MEYKPQLGNMKTLTDKMGLAGANVLALNPLGNRSLDDTQHQLCRRLKLYAQDAARKGTQAMSELGAQ